MGFFSKIGSWFFEPKKTEIKKLNPKAFFDFNGGFGGFSGAGLGYNAASQKTDLAKWNPPICGPNFLNYDTWYVVIRRARDLIRNSPIANSAIQKFVSNHVGSGIKPGFQHPDPEIRVAIQKAWDRWAIRADFEGFNSFYGLQELLCREIFEGGECFVRYHVNDSDDFFQIQLIEGEQVPIWNTFQQTPVWEGRDGDKWKNTTIKLGIIFDNDTNKRVGYAAYKSQPYDSIVSPIDSTKYVNFTTDEMIMVMKPLRAGALRGEPFLLPVMISLFDLETYADAERLRKKLAAMFAFFITKPSIDSDPLLPVDHSLGANDPGVAQSPLEPGTAQYLGPGEDIKSPTVPESGDYEKFNRVELLKIASGLGLTYEQLTNDYRNVTYSSARVAQLEFRRQARQFQNNVLIYQFCEPVMKRWLKEAVMSGDIPEISIEDYINNPSEFEACTWVAEGWEWVDPKNEVESTIAAIRGGLTSRSHEVRAKGQDPEKVDAEIATERKREESLDIVTDSNSNLILIGKESQPTVIKTVRPDEAAEEEVSEDDSEDAST